MSGDVRPPADLSAVKRALLARQLRAQLEGLEILRSEPIAVIGMGCRFPGAEDPEAWWRLLRDGIDAITEVPADRWSADAWYDPDPDAPGRLNTRWGGFVRDLDRFDPVFFGISPREAVAMDPQQRLALEVSWEALENAGIVPDALAGSRTGVFFAAYQNDYAWFQYADPPRVDGYTISGTAHCIVANRLSYLLDLHGPSMVIDTACSASLVTLHLACQSLRAGESDLALAGGVNVILSPLSTLPHARGHVMAADGRCKTFDAAADGFVRGEGCGVVVLKRLADALTDGDPVLSVVRGSAVNQDGRTTGLSAPSGLAQEAVIRAALENAGLEPDRISYVEAHGTGTILGDPIELEALAGVYGRRPADRPCLIGSAKTNMGHLEAAAGVAGLIKVVLAMQHEAIPPHLHFSRLNPHIGLEGVPFTIPTRLTPWRATDGRRFAGVSSFGFGGTNAHAVLEEAPAVHRPIVEAAPPYVLCLSARTPAALRTLAGRYATHLETHPEQPVADVCFGALEHRSHFPHRVGLAGDSRDALRQQLSELAAGKAAARGVAHQVSSRGRPGLAFLYTGQGAQYVGMGWGLYETQPVFRKALERCDLLLRQFLEQPLLTVLYPQTGASTALDLTAYTQPALFALQYALTALFQTWGVVPDAVMGHSVGEYAAACAAGVFDVESGLELVAARGRLMQALHREGEMAAVFAGEAVVLEALGPYEDRVAIAAVNGPEEVVVSGARDAVLELQEQLHAQGVRSRRLNVSHAFHSPLMEPMLEPFEAVAARMKLKAPSIRLISNVTGSAVQPDTLTSARYWRRHVQAPVRFQAGMEALRAAGCGLFLEIGPKPVLCELGPRCLPDERAVFLPTLRKGHDDLTRVADTLAALYAHGVALKTPDALRADRRRVSLPTYPFDRQRYWVTLDPARGTAAAPHGGGGSIHPLLGVKLRSAAKGVQFEAQLSPERLPFLADHRLFGAPVLSATCYVELALAAANQLPSGPLPPAPVSHASGPLPPAPRSHASGPLPPAPRSHASGPLPPAPLPHGGRGEEPALEAPSPHGGGGLGVGSPARAGGLGVGSLAPILQVEDLVLHEALFPGNGVTVQCVLTPDEGGRSALEIYSLEGEDRWRLHATARIVRDRLPPEPDHVAHGERPARGGEADEPSRHDGLDEVPVAPFYDAVGALGLELGPQYRGLARLYRGGDEMVGEIVAPEAVAAEASRYLLHPALLDAALQPLAALLLDRAGGDAGIALPVGLERLVVYRKSQGPLRSHARLRDGTAAQVIATAHPQDGASSRVAGDIRLYDATGALVAELQGLTLQVAAKGAGAGATESLLHEVRWRPKPLEAPDASSARAPWLILMDRGGLGEAVARRLERLGTQVLRLNPSDNARLSLVLSQPGDGRADRPALPAAGDVLPSLPSEQTTGRADVKRLPGCPSPQRGGVRGEVSDPLGDGVRGEVRNVLYLCSLDGRTSDRTTAEDLEAAEKLVCGNALQLIQALASRSGGRPLEADGVGSQLTPRLWWVTRGAQPVGEVSVALEPAQAPLWGLARTVALEHPELRPVLVDLDPAEDIEAAASRLIAELTAPDQEDQVGYRRGIRHVARLVQSSRIDAGGAVSSGPNPSGPTATRTSTQRALEAPPMRWEITRPGVLDDLELRPYQRRAPGPGEVEIEVDAAGLNFREVLSALGMVPPPATGSAGSRSAPGNGEIAPDGPRATPSTGWGTPGTECAGTVVAVGSGLEPGEDGEPPLEPGDQVIALTAGAFGPYVTVDARLVVRRPARLNAEEAATLPVAFLTAYYALHVVGGMRRGERVLIHAAAGGVGLAAVQLAQRAGAEVFATAGTPEKRAYLERLGIQHVMSSRTLEFADQIRAATGGAGVDLVLNALVDAFIPRSLALLRPGGHFIELGKRDLWDPERVAQVAPGVTYHAFDLSEIARETPRRIRAMLLALRDEVDAGRLEPLPRQVFPMAQAVSAFRTMAQARHLGKVVLVRTEAAQETPTPRDAAGDQSLNGAGTASQPRDAAGTATTPVDAIPERRLEDSRLFLGEGTALITGGLGGLGLQVARRLAARGARHLVLVGRRPPGAAALETIDALIRDGARVVTLEADVSREEDVARLLERIRRTLPPLTWVIHASGVLDDGVLTEQRWERFARVMAPKVLGAWHLHVHTRHLPLERFVMFSSMASLLGSPGQGNYAAANAFLDTLAHRRRASGLPALSVSWGGWAGAGMAAPLNERDQRRWARLGVNLMSPAQALEALEMLLERNATHAGVLPVRWTPYLAQFPPGATPPLLCELAPVDGNADQAGTREDLIERLRVAPPSRRRSLMADYVREAVARALGFEAGRAIDLEQGFNAMGMDSLTAVELRNRLQNAVGRPLPATLALEYPNIDAVSGFLVELLFPVTTPTEAYAGASGVETAVWMGAADTETPGPVNAGMHTPTGEADRLARLEALSEDEAEALMLEKLSRLDKRL